MPRALLVAALLLSAAACARATSGEETKAATNRAAPNQATPDRLMARSPEQRERVDMNATRITCKEPTPSIPC
jgi:hypothetical protein